MKRFIILILIALMVSPVVTGCVSKKETGPIVARVNEYKMTIDDLKEDIENSPYSADEKKDISEFLDLSIRKQVLIQEAQKLGLDRQKPFMKTIERYWEQTLIRELLKQKIQEISKTVPKSEQTQALDVWIEKLYKDSDIVINEDVLNKFEID